MFYVLSCSAVRGPIFSHGFRFVLFGFHPKSSPHGIPQRLARHKVLFINTYGSCTLRNVEFYKYLNDVTNKLKYPCENISILRTYFDMRPDWILFVNLFNESSAISFDYELFYV